MLTGGALLGILGWLWRYITNYITESAKDRALIRQDVSNYKLHVAETYTSKNDMAVFDLKITAHLVRIEDKLDRVKKAPE